MLSPKQIEVQHKAREFVKKHIKPYAREWESIGDIPVSAVKACHEAGFLNLFAPPEVGGTPLDTVSAAIVMEELSNGCLGASTAFGANNLCSYPVLLAGTTEQKQKHFKPLLEGKFGAFALTEPGAGSDAGAVKTTAVRDGDEYVLNGTKCYITQGGVAATFIIIASTDRTKGTKGLSAFIVERDRPGFSVGKVEEKMGIRSSNTVELILENVRIPAWHLIGQEGEGMKLAMLTLDSGRLMVSAQAVGVARAALDECIEFVKKRIDNGKPLSRQQSVAFKIADMATAIEAGRSLVYRGAKLKDAHEPYSQQAAMTKLYCTDMAMQVARDAMDIMGAYGYTQEAYVEKIWRDARILSIYEGTNEIQRLVISGSLLR